VGAATAEDCSCLGWGDVLVLHVVVTEGLVVIDATIQTPLRLILGAPARLSAVLVIPVKLSPLTETWSKPLLLVLTLRRTVLRVQVLGDQDHERAVPSGPLLE